ncbi:hypothetical protein [Sharpea azabuensis]|uniref:hypothetical protein n=1 Tax=Sharpea azabuensis TaxID=322505 RepID=UPI0024092605|nr:hypothetical protein [Sharpea azabuensis]MDD6513209.1 hypothetical protein [Sharpea azabuensis]
MKRLIVCILTLLLFTGCATTKQTTTEKTSKPTFNETYEKNKIYLHQDSLYTFTRSEVTDYLYFKLRINIPAFSKENGIDIYNQPDLKNMKYDFYYDDQLIKSGTYQQQFKSTDGNAAIEIFGTYLQVKKTNQNDIKTYKTVLHFKEKDVTLTDANKPIKTNK